MKESKIFTERNLTEKVHYVYRVTIDGKYYIGKRSGFLNDLHAGRYKTSSKIIQEKLKNGLHFSKIKILQVFSSSKDALEFEKRILLRVNAKANPKFLNQHNGNGNYTFKQHTEETKEKIKEYYNPNTEEGRKRRENHSKKMKLLNDINTEEGIKRREGISKREKERFNPETEAGRKRREKQSQISSAQFDKNTEYGRKQREIQSEIKKAKFDKNTEEGRKRCEDMSKIQRNRWDENTERGRKLREEKSETQRKFWDKNTEEGRKRCKNHSEFMKENGKNIRQKGAETQIQNRKDASILGDLMFDEDFIRQNLLITDDKNNIRFLWSVYSKLSGYKESSIVKEKRIGKLSFLSGIKSISISEELENAKIEAIEAIIKSKNNQFKGLERQKMV